jgi:dephospho-CoA kinase
VFDADETVHRLYSKGGRAVQPIQEVFPSAIVDGAIDRSILSQIVLSDPTSLLRLEGIIHPLVAQERSLFLDNGIQRQNLLVVYDIPLLMKHPEKHQVDYSIVVTASSQTQRCRVLSRPGMTEEKFQNILSKQVPDETQRQNADYVIDTDYAGYSEAKSQLANILQDILHKNDEKWKLWSSLPLPTTDPISGGEKLSRQRLRDRFDLIIFDLDDTLLPVMGPVMDAHHAQMVFLSTVLNRSTFDALKANLSRETRRSVDISSLPVLCATLLTCWSGSRQRILWLRIVTPISAHRLCTISWNSQVNCSIMLRPWKSILQREIRSLIISMTMCCPVFDGLFTKKKSPSRSSRIAKSRSQLLVSDPPARMTLVR